MTSASDDLRGTASLGMHARTAFCAVALSGGLILLGAGPASAVEQTPEESPSPTTAIDAGQHDDADQEDGTGDEGEDQPEQDEPEQDQPAEQDAPEEPEGTDEEDEAPSEPEPPQQTESPEPSPSPDDGADSGDSDGGTAPPEQDLGTEPAEPDDGASEDAAEAPEGSTPALQCRSATAPTGGTVSVQVGGSDSLQIDNGTTGFYGGTAQASGDTVTYTAPSSGSGTDTFEVVDAAGEAEGCSVSFTFVGSDSKTTEPGQDPGSSSSDSSAERQDAPSTPTGNPEYGVPGMPSTSDDSAAESPDPSDSSQEDRQSDSDSSDPGSSSQDEGESQDAEQETSDEEEDLAETGMNSANTMSALLLALGALLSGVAALMVARRRA